jgi:hypothetical protein
MNQPSRISDQIVNIVMPEVIRHPADIDFRKIISLCYRSGMAYWAYPLPDALRNELSESL